MRDTRLIFVEGLPGSGKSTTAEFITAEFAARGVPVRLLHEREPDHPLNVGGDIHPSGDVTGAELFARHDAQAFMGLSLSYWHDFVSAANGADVVYILDSHPYQNCLRVLLQMDTEPERIGLFEAAVERAAAPMRPALIFYHMPTVEGWLRGVCAHRGPAWTEYAVSVITDCPYARARGLEGFDGAVELMRAYAALLDEQVARFPYPKLVLPAAPDGFTLHEAVIRNFLDPT